MTRKTTTSADYDSLNRKVEDVDAYGNRTKYDYDPLGRIQTVIQRDGKTIRYGYDEVGRRTREYWQSEPYYADGPGSTVIVSDYDAGDRLVDTVQAKANVVPTEGVLPGTFAQTFVYPTSPLTVVDTSRTRFTYDPLGRRQTESPAIIGGFSLTYRYDAAGRRTGITDSQGGGQTTGYDLANRVTSQSLYQPGGQSVAFLFQYRTSNGLSTDDHLETMTGTAINNPTYPVSETLVYDNLGREMWRTKLWSHPLPNSGCMNLTA